ncbi:unnamed protein product [Musa acuminata var. zebrina]
MMMCVGIDLRIIFLKSMHFDPLQVKKLYAEKVFVKLTDVRSLARRRSQHRRFVFLQRVEVDSSVSGGDKKCLSGMRMRYDGIISTLTHSRTHNWDWTAPH